MAEERNGIKDDKKKELPALTFIIIILFDNFLGNETVSC